MNHCSILVFSLFVLAACDAVSISGSSGQQAAARASSTAATEVVLSGANGQAVLGGDTLVIKEGKFFINNKFIHDVPRRAVVRYSVVNNVRTLSIDNALISVNNESHG